MNASRNRLGWLASLGNVDSRPRYPKRYAEAPHSLDSMHGQMSRMSQRKAAGHTEQLLDLGVDARQVYGDDFNRISREWLARFCPNVKRDTGKWVYNGYRWHAYSFGHETALKGIDAVDAYISKHVQPFYMYFEVDDLLFDCKASNWPDLRALENDIYVFPHGMSWTFITTHEMSMDLGPYFATPPS